MDIHHALGVARGDAAHLSRYMNRRDRFLDALDWSMLTDEQARQATMLDEMLEDDLAAAVRHIDWLVRAPGARGNATGQRDAVCAASPPVAPAMDHAGSLTDWGIEG